LALKGKNIVILLDIGTARISMAAVRIISEKSFEVLAQDESPSLGVRKGLIRDIDSVARIIGSLMENMQERTGMSFGDVYAVFSGTGIKVIECSSRLALGSRRRIQSADVSELLKQASQSMLLDGLVQLHLLPLQYRLDGRVVNVVEGKSGRELEVDARVVLAPKESVQAVYDAGELAGKTVRKVVFGSMVEAPLMTNKAELDLGCVLVNLGAATTTVSVFKYGTLLNAVVLPVGMEHVVGDLAVGLHTSMENAASILHSLSLTCRDVEIKSVEARENGPGHSYPHTESLVFSIVDARLQEICELIKKAIYYMNISGFLPGGIKLTGGGAMLPGIADQFSRCLDIPVKDIAPFIAVPGTDNCALPLAGLAGYCCKHELRYISEGLEGMLGKLQSFVSAGNYFLRRLGG